MKSIRVLVMVLLFVSYMVVLLVNKRMKSMLSVTCVKKSTLFCQILYLIHQATVKG